MRVLAVLAVVCFFLSHLVVGAVSDRPDNDATVVVVIGVAAFFILMVVLIPLLGYFDGIVEPEASDDEPDSSSA